MVRRIPLTTLAELFIVAVLLLGSVPARPDAVAALTAPTRPGAISAQCMPVTPTRVFLALVLGGGTGVPGTNHLPTASSCALTLAQDTVVSVDFSELAVDADHDTLTFALATPPAHGTASFTGVTLSYTPTAGYAGADSLRYSVDDGHGGIATGIVTITITAGPPVNRVPTVTLDVTATSGTVPLQVTLTAVAVDVDGDPLTYSWDLDDGMTAGNVTTVTHTYTGTGRFRPRVTVSDGELHAQGTRTLLVNPPDDSPPDPNVLAPPLPQGVATPFISATEFLYTGPNPVQTGVVSGTLVPTLTTVLRGRVITRDGAALSRVSVGVLDHPEYGATLSRADGMWDLAVNGGVRLVVSYARDEYLPAQRQVYAYPLQYVALPDVALIQRDSPTTVTLGPASAPQVARGSVSSDGDGTRRATLLFPQGVTATLALPSGGTQPITTLHVRATEYTVGPNGPAAMPAELPPGTSYTYAAAYSVDEAGAAGATEVRFGQPIYAYVENFLRFPVGGHVPAGYYDRRTAAWVPSKNGRIVKIVAIVGGKATLDTDGDGVADDAAKLAALGVSAGELQRLASLYPAGQSLWRVPITRLTTEGSATGLVGGRINQVGTGPDTGPWDFNWGSAPDPRADPPKQPKPDADRRDPDPCTQFGSIIECQNQTLGETAAVAGTPFVLHYMSDRVAGRSTDRTLQIPLSGATLPPTLARIDLIVTVAGRTTYRSFPAVPNQRTTFTWDGKDAYNRVAPGTHPVHISLGYVYPTKYLEPAERPGLAYDALFGHFSFYGKPLTGDLARQEVTFWQYFDTTLRYWDARGQGLGGWTLDVHHTYDPADRTLYLGTGEQHSVGSVGSVVSTMAGACPAANCPPGYNGDNIPATQARLGMSYSSGSIAVGPDGSVYIADGDNRRIRRVRPDGIITTVAGQGSRDTCDSGDGGSALQANLCPISVAVAPDGTIYFSTVMQTIRRVGTDGIITTVAGHPGFCYDQGDGGPARNACLIEPRGLAVGSDGSLYIADFVANRVRKIGLDGIITTAVGTGEACSEPPCGDGLPAPQAGLPLPSDVVFGPDGSLYITFGAYGNVNGGIRRVRPDGIITTIVGGPWSKTSGYGGDGGPAIDARLYGFPRGLVVAPDGTIFFADSGNNVVRRIGTDGIITRYAGTQYEYSNYNYGGDGGPATLARLFDPLSLALEADGSLLIADTGNNRVRRVSPVLPTTALGEIPVPAADGDEVYVFDTAGRHLRTVDSLTGVVRHRFGYDAQGRLASIVDSDGNTTTVERDAGGNPTEIHAPVGQRTTLTLDGVGNLARIVDPAGGALHLLAAPDGLLTTLTDLHGGIHRFAYDAQGRLVRDENPLGEVQTLARTGTSTSFTVTLTTALSNTTVFAVQQAPDGSTLSTTIGPNGTVATIRRTVDGTQTGTYADGSQVTLTTGPDPRWGMRAPVLTGLTIRTPSRLQYQVAMTRTVTLAQPGDLLNVRSLTETVTVNGRTATQRYDATTRTFRTTSAAGRVSTATVDTHGRVVRMVAAPGVTPITARYDTQGRLTEQRQGTQALSYTYDAANYLESVRDAANHVTHYAYDAAGRVVALTQPDGAVYRYAYDVAGNLVSVTMPSGAVHGFAASALDQIASYTPPGTASYAWTYDHDGRLQDATLPGGRTERWSYDAGGRATSMAYPEALIAFTYGSRDASERAKTITRTPASGTPQELALGYDAALLRSSVATGVAQGQFQYSYDANFLLKTLELTVGANTLNLAVAQDADGLLTTFGPFSFTRNGPGGATSRVSDGGVSLQLGYDTSARMNRRALNAGPTAVYAAQFSFGPDGRVATKQETLVGTAHTYAYTYDAAGQLRSVSRDSVMAEQYSYDVNGNRTSRQIGTGTAETATYDGQDMLTQRGGVAYRWDADGYLTQRGADTFEWSTHGELLAATVGGQIVRYGYDGLGRRVGRTAAGQTTQYLYGNPADTFQLTAVRDGSGVLATLYYDDLGFLLAVERGGIRYGIATDQVGTPRAVTTPAGQVVKTLDYDSFGVVTRDSNPAFDLPIGYAGGLADTATGLVHFGFRDYDPAAGRWTARDPALFGGGQGNLYAYVGNDPVNLRDPLGLFCVGGSVYAGGGAGAQFCITEKGISACVEGGFGAGEEVDVSFNGDLAEPGPSLFAEVEGKLAGFHAKGGILLRPCAGGFTDNGYVQGGFGPFIFKPRETEVGAKFEKKKANKPKPKYGQGLDVKVAGRYCERALW